MSSLSLILGINLGSCFEISTAMSMRTGSWGDFNEVHDASEKCGGRRKIGATMDEFRRVVSDLADSTRKNH